MGFLNFNKKPKEEVNSIDKDRKDFVKKEHKVVQGFRAGVNRHSNIPKDQSKTKGEKNVVHISVGGQRISITSTGGRTPASTEKKIRQAPEHQSGNFIRFAGEKTIGRGSSVHSHNPIHGAAGRVFGDTRGGHNNVSKYQKNTQTSINNIFYRKKK